MTRLATQPMTRLATQPDDEVLGPRWAGDHLPPLSASSPSSMTPSGRPNLTISISLLRMRAGIKPELCHIVGQLAQVCLLKVIMGELERERARRRARFGL